jgi:hypothetical protein
MGEQASPRGSAAADGPEPAPVSMQTPALRDRGLVLNRVYADFLMPSRLDAYEALIRLALEQGYEVRACGTFWSEAQAEDQRPARRVLVLRHDVDTDPVTARAMWSIDRRLGVRSSYFFRLSTIDRRLMREIEEAGGEASYHYEELATLIKRRRLRTREQALACLPEARALFAENLDRLRREVGLPMRVVASHGDFSNRRLSIANSEILADAAIRERTAVILDPYDAAFLELLPQRFTDVPHPRYWSPSPPERVLREGVPVVSVLVHPRHWRTDRWINARDDAGRVLEGLLYRLPVSRR